MTLPAARMFDLDLVHCLEHPVRAEGSPNVLVNGRMWNRMGDFNMPHLRPCGTFCCGHKAPIAIGSARVIVNGRGAVESQTKCLPAQLYSLGHRTSWQVRNTSRTLSPLTPQYCGRTCHGTPVTGCGLPPGLSDCRPVHTVGVPVGSVYLRRPVMRRTPRQG